VRTSDKDIFKSFRKMLGRQFSYAEIEVELNRLGVEIGYGNVRRKLGNYAEHGLIEKSQIRDERNQGRPLNVFTVRAEHIELFNTLPLTKRNNIDEEGGGINREGVSWGARLLGIPGKTYIMSGPIDQHTFNTHIER
jgi:hypothetical protein